MFIVLVIINYHNKKKETLGIKFFRPLFGIQKWYDIDIILWEYK